MLDKYNIDSVTSLEQAINNEAPSLAYLTKYQDRKFSCYLLVTMIAQYSVMVKVGESFKDPNNILRLSKLIYEDFYYLKVSEVDFILRNGVKGKYGQIYGSLEPNMILHWFSEYDKERYSFSENRSYDRYVSQKEKYQDRNDSDFSSFRHEYDLDNFKKEVKNGD